jgi:hypothetical protein
MVRTRIQLTERQSRAIRAKAREQGLSIAEVIRRCVDTALKAEEPRREALYSRAARLAGRFPDRKGGRDLSRRHDDSVEDLFG